MLNASGAPRESPGAYEGAPEAHPKRSRTVAEALRVSFAGINEGEPQG